MIARIFIPVVLAIVLSYLYVDLHYWRHRQGYCWWKRVLWWAPAVVMLVYTAGLASVHNFVPDNLGKCISYSFRICGLSKCNLLSVLPSG